MKVKPNQHNAATPSNPRQTAARQSAVAAAAALASAKRRTTTTTPAAAAAAAAAVASIRSCHVEIDRLEEDSNPRMKRASLRSTASVPTPPQQQQQPPPKKRGRPPRAAISADSPPSSQQRPAVKGQQSSAGRAGAASRSLHGHDKALLRHVAVMPSKRTPKPNRRYMNEHTVSKVTTSSDEDDADGEERRDSDEEGEHELDQSQDEPEEREEGDDEDEDAEHEEEDDEEQHEQPDEEDDDDDHDEASSQEEQRVMPTRRRAAAVAPVAVAEPARGRGRPPLVRKAAEVPPKPKSSAAAAAAAHLATVNSRRLPPQQQAIKRKIDYTSDSASMSGKRTPVASAAAAKKHTRRSAIVQSDLDDQDPSDEDYKEPVRPPAKRLRTSAPSALDAQPSNNSRPSNSNLAASAAAAAKKSSLSASNTPAQKQLDSANSSPQLAAKRSALSATLKKLNSNSAPAAPAPVAQKSLQMTSATPLNRRAPVVSVVQRTFGNAAGTTIRRAVVPVVRRRGHDADEADEEEGIDIEQHTPTFTIVNINDIINQKKDCVIEQTSTLQTSGGAGSNAAQQAVARRGRPAKKLATARVDSDDVDYQPGVETEADDGSMDDDDDPGRKTRTINRRKAQHIIMSERMKAVKPAAAATPKLLNTLKNAVPTQQRPYRNIIKQNGQATTAGGAKPAPRILNSTLCRNVSQLESHPQIHTIKRNVSGGSGENNLNTTNANNNNNVLKTYAGNNRGAASAGGATATTGLYNASAARKVQPPPKTVISHQVVPGGQTRRVRKITCYETWFVIKLPSADPPTAVPKAELAISLVRLGNEIATVALPSDAWSYKVSLQRKPAATNSRNSNGDTTQTDGDAAEVYTGDLHDANIPEADRRLFAPTSIMFRRSSANQQLRMQFDRAVIFKNGAFYINIEGKNVRLLAAPAKLQSIEELEVLLEIVDSVALNSSLVEQMAYA